MKKNSSKFNKIYISFFNDKRLHINNYIDRMYYIFNYYLFLILKKFNFLKKIGIFLFISYLHL